MKSVIFSTVTVASASVDCSTVKCPSTCSCVASTCGDLEASCTADSQCDGIMNCLMGCACSDVFCALGCVAGKTLDSVSSKVKSCASGCASSDEGWETYKLEFKKTYASDDDEAERKELFK